jgi:hypothetical protein
MLEANHWTLEECYNLPFLHDLTILAYQNGDNSPRAPARLHMFPLLASAHVIPLSGDRVFF